LLLHTNSEFIYSHEFTQKAERRQKGGRKAAERRQKGGRKAAAERRQKGGRPPILNYQK